MPKTIVQILRAPIGGIRKHVFDILEYLESKDVQQIFITNTSDKDAELPLYNNLEIFNVVINDRPELNDFKNLVLIFKFLKMHKVDIIHGHGAKGGVYARILAFLLGAKCIYTPHGGSLHRVYGKIKNEIYDLVELLFLPITDVYLFESYYSRDEFTKNIGNPKGKMTVNYNGVDIPNDKASNQYVPGEKFNLASFGLLRELKGHDIFVQTCALLLQENIPFSYTIYGRGEQKAFLIDLIKTLNLEGHVFIKDYSANVLEDMLKYNFIVHPSRFESFGYVPVEAMSLGIPVIVSAEGGLREVVDETCGFVSKNNTPDDYFFILKNIYSGKVLVKDKTFRALIKVQEKFSKKEMIREIYKIYCL